MKILTLEQARRGRYDRVYRESSKAHLIALLVIVAGVGGAFVWYWYGDLPLGLLLLFGACMFLFALLELANLRKTFSPANCLMMVSRDGVCVKLRSYLNQHLPETDAQAAFFAFDEIRAVRKTKQTLKSSDRRGRTKVWRVTSLDLILAKVDLSSLEGCLRHEKTVKAKTKHHHYPVSIPDVCTVRVRWRAPDTHTVPKIDIAIQEFTARGVRLEEAQAEDRDLQPSPSDSREQMEEKILELVENGRKIQAIGLARKTYGMSLREAKDFVEGLLR
jgi:hypothetical protein